MARPTPASTNAGARTNGRNPRRSRAIPHPGLLAAGVGTSMLALVLVKQLAHVLRSVRVTSDGSRPESSTTLNDPGPRPAAEDLGTPPPW
jgi:hypothetical protein